MLFWLFIVLTMLSLVFMIWGFIASRKIAVVDSSSEGFADKASVIVDKTTIDKDLSDGQIGIKREFKYGYGAKASGSVFYSTEAMAKAWRSGDKNLKFSVAAIIAGLIGIFLFLGLAIISNGGNQVFVGIGVIVFGLLGLRGFLGNFYKAVKLS